jgi:hydrogenase maturation protein HypF
MRVRVSGTVQGVGFRPFVFRLADELALDGWVRNDERGVELEVEGERAAVGELLRRLREDAPPLASVEGVSASALVPRGTGRGRAFTIVASAGNARAAAVPVATDAATCDDCLAELHDPGDRRFRYPFVNCTNCGPRFTIVRGVPYDRALTTMAGFEMCAACRAEYEDPLDRRFHAQPIACPACGPRVRLLAADGSPHRRADARAGGSQTPDAVAAAAALIAEGGILAVKGLGGYHLACRADASEPVRELRARKHREHRPFALMVADATAARRLIWIDEQHEALLTSGAGPIVLAPRRAEAAVSPPVAPGANELGVMLAYSPLHHLLLADVAERGIEALLMTSGNRSDEPIAYEDEDALERLRAIADAFLTHDRPIHTRTDDSVVRVVEVDRQRRPIALRRSRGYVPASIELVWRASRPLLACGAELKSTFALARGEKAWVSHHIGDLSNWETLRSFREGVTHFERLFAVSPSAIAHDLHPEYLSTKYAVERRDLAEEKERSIELIAVQHHHAHLAAVLAEHGERGPAVGVIYDGAGYGPDGTAWGGELLVGGLDSFERSGHLRAVRLPGGDAAAREPWRMACAWIAQSTGEQCPPIPEKLERSVSAERWSAVARLATGGLGSLETTSVGRLCDAVAAICGFGTRVSYEGQAAIELEAIADLHEHGRYDLPFEEGRLDARPLITAVLGDVAAGLSSATVSARFHRALAAASAEACVKIAHDNGISLVVLGGGVFQNRLLLEDLAAALVSRGLRVLLPERLPPNDGAISYGQAAIAAARHGRDMQ